MLLPAAVITETALEWAQVSMQQCADVIAHTSQRPCLSPGVVISFLWFHKQILSHKR